MCRGNKVKKHHKFWLDRSSLKFRWCKPQNYVSPSLRETPNFSFSEGLEIKFEFCACSCSQSHMCLQNVMNIMLGLSLAVFLHFKIFARSSRYKIQKVVPLKPSSVIFARVIRDFNIQGGPKVNKETGKSVNKTTTVRKQCLIYFGTLEKKKVCINYSK